MNDDNFQTIINEMVKSALHEDIGTGDITAALIPKGSHAKAVILAREPAILCGQAWVNTTFSQIDPGITINWHASDGEPLLTDQHICSIEGPARNLLSGERTALNFLQTLSGTATTTQRYVKKIDGLPVKLLDTRKTIPGFRIAQKYAVRCGGGHNHRIGLYDAILIKENHIAACGSIQQSVMKARQLSPGINIEVEVETLSELQQALTAQADTILLDNFDIENLEAAVALNKKQAQLEASGGITLDTIYSIAETGVDAISTGALTKDIRAIDLSMLFIEP